MRSKADARARFSAFIEEAINNCPKTQLQIAEDLGYNNANIISMFKAGITRVPLDKVTPLARSLLIDPPELLHAWFEAYAPGMLPELEQHMGEMLTANERTWIRGLWKALGRVPVFEARWGEAIKMLVDDEMP